MTQIEPRIAQQQDFGEPDAPATSWADAERRLAEAELYPLPLLNPVRCHRLGGWCRS
jgi:hypothetical protein